MDDTLPNRVRALPVMVKSQSESDCAVKDYEGMLDDYYEACGWELELACTMVQKNLAGKKKMP